MQRALYDATKEVSGMPGEEVKQRLRTGTVVTTDDRNWELRYSASALRFNLSRAVAIDMESATIAAQGYRFRVPYGTLLCVSDKPLHGEIKLPGGRTVLRRGDLRAPSDWYSRHRFTACRGRQTAFPQAAHLQ